MSENIFETIDPPENARNAISPSRIILLWWEKKRWLYNLFICFWIVFINIENWDYPMREIIGTKTIILENFYLLIACNIAYAAGWALELFFFYFLSKQTFHVIFKWVLFVLGTLFSLFIILFYLGFLFDVLFA
jgi:hypothetical protein